MENKELEVKYWQLKKVVTSLVNEIRGRNWLKNMLLEELSEEKIVMFDPDLFMVDWEAKIDGISLQNYMVTSYDKLLENFGKPIYGDGFKVSTQWVFKSKLGQVVTLYDWKVTNLFEKSGLSVTNFRSLPYYEWHVGAHTKEAADFFITWLRIKLRDSNANS